MRKFSLCSDTKDLGEGGEGELLENRGQLLKKHERGVKAGWFRSRRKRTSVKLDVVNKGLSEKGREMVTKSAKYNEW